MTATEISVRDCEATDAPVWLRLWEAYNRFYGANLPELVTETTWLRILDPAAPLVGRLAERGGDVVGFSVSVLHAGTWTIAPICYLEDLFVDADARGRGVGRALMEDLLALSRARGWSRLYWHTQVGNTAARRLYDTFIEADDFVRYRLFLS
jgi:Acetyltransferases